MDSGSSIGYATRPQQISRIFTQKLGDLVGDGSLSAAVDPRVPPARIEPVQGSLSAILEIKSPRKILFRLGY